MSEGKDLAELLKEELESDDIYDKSDWGDGPWQGEPDRVEWRLLGFKCLILRGPMGTLCGYVGVPPGHPCYGLNMDEVRTMPIRFPPPPPVQGARDAATTFRGRPKQRSTSPPRGERTRLRPRPHSLGGQSIEPARPQRYFCSSSNLAIGRIPDRQG